MKTLAVEISTGIGSLALMEGRLPLIERQWEESRNGRQGYFTVLNDLIASGALKLAEVDLFVVGVGPGSFAGLRMAVSAASGLAVPGGRSVVGIFSAEAVASEMLNESNADEVVVWGDARRNELWAMRFKRGTQWPDRQGELMVQDFSSVPEDWVKGKALWVTADYERIGDRLKALVSHEVTLIDRSVMPKARYLGLLGVAKREAGEATEPLLPVYVHPAVAGAHK
jgi:tRNA threonylcarbamoyladenosine biosynthesis protein TsaB